MASYGADFPWVAAAELRGTLFARDSRLARKSAHSSTMVTPSPPSLGGA